MRAGGVEPPWACARRIFLPSTAFAALDEVWSLDYPFTVPRTLVRWLGAARLVSTPSRSVPPGLARDCHFTGFPEFEQFCIVGFPASTQVGLSPLRLPVPPRSHSAVTYTWPSQSGQSCRG